MHPMLNTALTVARTTGDMIAQAAEQVDLLDVEAKGVNDFVTRVDKASEESIIEGIRKRYPNHAFLGENTGLIEGTDDGKDYVWIIAPLDGATNFINGVPHFAISIALTIKDQIEVAVVLDPMRKEEFTAARGRGAQLNGKRLRVNSRKALPGTLLATGFPFRPNQLDIFDSYMGMFKDFAQQCAGIRRQGAPSLDLAYVAAGRYDGFWEFGLKEWDMAAGILLVQEAGGLVGDLNGGMCHMKSGNLVCAQPKLFKAMLQTIRPHLKG